MNSTPAASNAAAHGLVVGCRQRGFVRGQFGPAFTIQVLLRHVFGDLARRDFVAARFGA
jgi:hypothetical protein